MLRFRHKNSENRNRAAVAGLGHFVLAKRIRVAFVLILATLLAGVIGFRMINHISWLDALYLTVVTLSTVGYGDMVSRGDEGHLFTTLFIFCGIGTASYSAAILMGGLIEGEIQGALKKRRTMKQIQQLRDHVILCGFGRVGSSVAERLSAEHTPFVIVEHNPAQLAAAEALGYTVLDGNATNDDILLFAGIVHARALITTLPEDAQNLFVVLSARQLNEGLRIVSRASEESNGAKILKAGADDVALPERIGGNHLAQAAVRPAVLEFLQFSHRAADQFYQVEEFKLGVGAKSLVGRTLIEANLRVHANIIILGIKRPDGEMVFNPGGTTRMEAGDTLVVVGIPAELDKLRKGNVVVA